MAATSSGNGNGNGKKQFWTAISLVPVALVVGAIFHSGFYVGHVRANTHDNKQQDLKIEALDKEIDAGKIHLVKVEGEVNTHYKEILALLKSQNANMEELKQDMKDNIDGLKQDMKDDMKELRQEIRNGS